MASTLSRIWPTISTANPSGNCRANCAYCNTCRGLGACRRFRTLNPCLELTSVVIGSWSDGWYLDSSISASSRRPHSDSVPPLAIPTEAETMGPADRNKTIVRREHLNKSVLLHRTPFRSPPKHRNKHQTPTSLFVCFYDT